MTSQKGRGLLLKIGDGEDPEVFNAIGAARATQMLLNNQPAETTSMAGNGMREYLSEAGLQSLAVKLDGLFKDAAAEERLREAAFSRGAMNYELQFPNGDKYAARFVVQEYQRGGTFDGLEVFSVTLARSGAGVFTNG
jgi:predicted secreted protein